MLKTEWEERPAAFRREAQAAMRSLIALEDWERMGQASSKNPWMAIIPVQEDNAGLTREVSDAAWSATPLAFMLKNASGRFCQQWGALLRDGTSDHEWADPASSKAMESMWRSEVVACVLDMVGRAARSAGRDGIARQNAARLATGLMSNPVMGEGPALEVGLECLAKSARAGHAWTATHRAEAELWSACWLRGVERCAGAGKELQVLERAFAAQCAAGVEAGLAEIDAAPFADPGAFHRRLEKIEEQNAARWALARAAMAKARELPALEGLGLGWGWRCASEDVARVCSVSLAATRRHSTGTAQRRQAKLGLAMASPMPLIERMCLLRLDDAELQARLEGVALGAEAQKSMAGASRRRPGL